jgi:hypothetical protein
MLSAAVCACAGGLIRALACFFASVASGVQRHPRNAAERAHNIDAVIRELAFAVPEVARRAALAAPRAARWKRNCRNCGASAHACASLRRI